MLAYGKITENDVCSNDEPVWHDCHWQYMSASAAEHPRRCSKNPPACVVLRPFQSFQQHGAPATIIALHLRAFKASSDVPAIIYQLFQDRYVNAGQPGNPWVPANLQSPL